MSDTSSLGSRLKQELFTDLSVSIVAVVLAVLALGVTTANDVVDGGLYLALNIAVFMPYAYEAYWPVEYASLPAAVWTVAAALITTGLYLGSYVLFALLVPEFMAPAAFIVTVGVQYATAALYARVRNNA